MNLTWITLFGGICLLIYGLHITRENLQKIAGDRLRNILSKLTENRLFTFLTGFFMTLILQSSSAAIAMVVGFASSALLTLTQAMIIILGADVGTTITVQLLAFHVADYSLLLVIIGFLLFSFLGIKKQAYGLFVMGIGFIFLGMWQMGEAGQSFKDSQILLLSLQLLKDYAFVSFLISAVLTALLQSSAASLGIILSFAHAGILPLAQALPLIIGANIGGCALPLLVSLKLGDRGKQVAFAHIFLKAFGAILIFPFLGSFETLVSWTATSESRQIANAHFLFNGALALLFIPLTHFGASFIQKLFPLKPEPEAFRPKYLDSHVLSTPSFAFGQASREVIRMAGIVQEMLEKSMVVFRKNDLMVLADIEKLEERNDILYREIKKYLLQLSQQTLSPEQASQQSDLIILTCDLENIGDAIVKSILPLARIKIVKKLFFSEEGFKEIRSFHDQVVQNFQLTISAFTNQNSELYKKVLENKEHLLHVELHLRENHLIRLRHGVKEAFDTSSLHIEILSHFGKINSFISNIAYQILHKDNGTHKETA
ncbi:MAG: Na/Pi cotransporter family protein [Deltaproteobacteria bacterium]|nr:Na/Pi cotransporter family protein [Deltaproteobacteria bacterium]